MTTPEILALDFDGVLCDGMHEYFETSRAHLPARLARRAGAPGADLLGPFSRLRPVILSGWEMPLLLRAIQRGASEPSILGDWETVRDELAPPATPEGEALIATLKRTVDAVRADWIRSRPAGWLAQNAPYCDPAELRRVVAAPELAVLVTTKEGLFARTILEHWGWGWPRSKARNRASTSATTCAPHRRLHGDALPAAARLVHRGSP